MNLLDVKYIEDDILLCDQKFFGDGNEHRYIGKFYDGIAVVHSEPEDKNSPETLVLTYPTLDIINSEDGNELDREIRLWCGLQPGDEITYLDVALKYGNPNIPKTLGL